MNLFPRNNKAMRTRAGSAAVKDLNEPWVERFMRYVGRIIPVAASRLTPADRFGSLKARWGLGRMRYRVPPGLYAVGEPNGDSSVFVTANYKMSFDALRSSLRDTEAWLLVLDTEGINVWCAAGKGTFGTEELIARIASTKLGEVVSHRELVLPQLGASGVSAPEIAKKTVFRVTWGPVRAADIPAWLASGKVKDAPMRAVSFTLGDRLAVAPMEVLHSWPIIPLALLLGALYGLPAGAAWLSRALPVTIILLGILPVGTVLFPALLPWIPSRAFVVKGGLLGAVWACACAVLFRLSPIAGVGTALIAAPVTGFLAMNFTGSSTFTSQGGALLEVERSFLPLVGALIAGSTISVVGRLLGI